MAREFTSCCRVACASPRRPWRRSCKGLLQALKNAFVSYCFSLCCLADSVISGLLPSLCSVSRSEQNLVMWWEWLRIFFIIQTSSLLGRGKLATPLPMTFLLFALPQAKIGFKPWYHPLPCHWSRLKLCMTFLHGKSIYS